MATLVQQLAEAEILSCHIGVISFHSMVCGLLRAKTESVFYIPRDYLGLSLSIPRDYLKGYSPQCCKELDMTKHNTTTTEGLPNSPIHKRLPVMTVLFFFLILKC